MCKLWGGYSLDEQKIGTLIDGKPIYRKTVQITMPNGNRGIDVGLQNIDMMMNIRGIFINSNNDLIIFNPTYDYDIICYYDKDTNLFFVTYSNNNPTLAYGYTAYVTFEYTKTTD